MAQESPGERAADHTWSIMSAIGGGLVVFVLGNLWSCSDGVTRFFWSSTLDELLAFGCRPTLPGIMDNQMAPLVIAALAAVLIGALVEIVMWIVRKSTPQPLTPND